MEQRILKMKDAKIREEGGKKYLEGYFSVFGEPYQVWDGWVETIERGAFARYLASGEDVKVLWNHDSNIVLGATGNGTASLQEDEVGLFGSVEINENDQEAVNAYARVARGDVDGCSFGFDIARQEISIHAPTKGATYDGIFSLGYSSTNLQTARNLLSILQALQCRTSHFPDTLL